MAVTAHAPRRSATLALLRPLTDADVLVPGEVYYYKHRAHWASLGIMAVETLSILFVGSLVLTGAGISSNLIFISLLIIAAVTLHRMFKSHQWSWTEYVGLGLAVLTAFSAKLSPPGIALLVMGWAFTRFAFAFLRWSNYCVRYITNRRIIEVNGLFGSRVSSMPITRLTDITLDRSIGGEVLEYGTLVVETAGQDQALGTIDFLLEPERFHELSVRLATRVVK